MIYLNGYGRYYRLCSNVIDSIMIDQRNVPLYENGAICSLLLCPECYIGMCLDGYGQKSCLNKKKLVKKNNTPAL